MKKLILSSVLGLAALFAVMLFNYGTNDVHAENGQAVFSGVNLSCEGCELQVRDALQNIVGIQDFHLDSQKGLITVSYNEAVMKPEWVEKSLESFGFHSIELE
ncbi:heavy-metal-associated domain-containing protein [Bacillus taeanensis]|nr:heavy-metal-associated domain-containing protein [Bacillus taeanensis]